MNQDQLFHDYQDFQSFVGWSAACEDHVRAAAAILEPHLGALIDDFYAEIARHAKTRRLIERGRTTIQRLKESLHRWLQELFAGPYDAQYVARRWQIGRRHIEVGLEHVYVSTAMARLRAGLVETLCRYWQGKPEDLVQCILSLNRLLDLDLTIIEVAYQKEYLARILRNEQLAKVGHVAGGVGHELRRPLNVLKTSAYYLHHVLKPDPAKREEHFQRIDRNMGAAEQILRELSDLARLPAPHLRPFQVGACIDEALAQVPLTDNIRLAKNFPPALPQALGDREQIREVFARLIRRAWDGLPDGGRLSIHGRGVPDAVEVVFEDTGRRVPREILAAIETPLSWASVRILGMNLGIAKALLDGNAGSVRGEHEASQGCKLTVTLAAVPLASAQGTAPLVH